MVFSVYDKGEFSALQTIIDWVRWGASRMQQNHCVYGHGTDNALDDSLVLVLHTLHLPHSIPHHFMQSRLMEHEKKAIHDVLRQRIETRLPTPYITHEAWFAGLPFFVDHRVLIPRSPIAELILHTFSPWLQTDRVDAILDLCTGSGCIAIACALQFNDAHVDACDISPDALSVAQQNVDRFNLQEQISLVCSDLFASLPIKKYQLIVSNPPYVDETEMNELANEYQHEPELGLHGGVRGLDIIQRILIQAIDYLAPGGLLVVEVGNSAHALVEAYPHLPFLWHEFEQGGEGVFSINYEQLQEHSESFQTNTGIVE